MHSDIINLNNGNISEAANLYLECFNAPDKGENWNHKTACDYLTQRSLEDSAFLSLRDKQGQLIGLSIGGDSKKSFIADELGSDIDHGYYISVIAISNKCQGLGYGQTLMTESLRHIKQAGFSNSIIRCRGENQPMRHIVEKNGFKQLKEYTSELGGINCNRVIYAKSLAISPK